jgi:hypothetical protein
MESGFVSSATRRVVFSFAWLLVLAGPAAAGDAFLRGGIILQPRDIGIEGRWRLSFGSDYAVNFEETLFAGFELQTSAFRQDIEGTTTSATIVPGNGFINVKFKSPNLGVRPYGGGGIGLLSTFFFVSDDSEWVRDFGFHLLGGIEMGRFSVELELARAFEEGSDTVWTAYAGFVW